MGSADDQAKIQAMDDNDFGDQSNKCGKGELGLTGINHDKFNTCLTGAIGISSDCSECYAVTADYGFKNCKAACLLGWCKQAAWTAQHQHRLISQRALAFLPEPQSHAWSRLLFRAPLMIRPQSRAWMTTTSVMRPTSAARAHWA